MEVIILASDAAIWVLVFCAILFFIWAAGQEHYRQAWRQIKTQKLAMIAGGILLVYVVIGVLDSFHFKLRALDEKGKPAVDSKGNPIYESPVLTPLDMLLSNCKALTPYKSFQPIKEGSEETYSAPLSPYQFTKKVVEAGDGRYVHEQPRLRFAGDHLNDPEKDHSTDIAAKILTGVVVGGLGGLFIWIILAFLTKSDKAFSQRFREMALFGFFMLGLSVLVAVCAILANKYHILGTDKTGRDVFYLALKSCRTGLIFGTITTLIVTPFAIICGIPAGYFGKWIDDVIQYVYTTLNSIPGILLIAAGVLVVETQLQKAQGLQTIVSSDIKLMWLCIILGITSWTGLCRLLRGETLKIRELEYVQAAHAFGVSHAGIMFRHILPNVMHIVLISIMMRFSGLVLAEAVLAYVGIGVDPNVASWGGMINAARLEVARDPVIWWNLIAAFIFMFGLVLPSFIFGNAVRDALDPRLKTA
jgi:peptide/nickel transport system permease protein